ncbi:MAG TPA: hypothetical protein VJU14_10510 [Solirubrobacterales bacterium]|nr:hypothetical protein [Solirubrobacterales bacterium]
MSAPESLTRDYLMERWPRLFHMAEAGSWDSIREHGLQSTSALLDRFDVGDPLRTEIESCRRPESVEITDGRGNSAWVRDNKRINETALIKTLQGMTLGEWYRNLNRRVFFWLTRQRLDKLRRAGAYKDQKHDILTIHTKRLMHSYGDVVELSPLNSGAVHPAANYPRGILTFSRIADYPWQERLAIAPSEPIVELTVPYSVNDISEFVIDVTTE